MNGDGNGGATSAGMSSNTIEGFLDALASETATPGGGAVAGLCGAAGAALISMVCRLTVGRDAYEEAEKTMRRYLEQAEAARGVFLELADRDAQAFEAVMAAFKLPKDDDRQKAERSAAIQRAYEGAARVPLEVARRAVGLMDAAKGTTELGNVNAASDGLVAAFALNTATFSALANVEINVAALKDEAVARELRGETEALKTRAEAVLSETKAAFSARLA